MSLELYLAAAAEAYDLAKAEHLAHLRAEHYPAWEPGGVHAFSRAIGELETKRAESMVLDAVDIWDGCRDLFWVDRYSIRRAAREDAAAEWEQERYRDWAMRMRVERRELGAAA